MQLFCFFLFKRHDQLLNQLHLKVHLPLSSSSPSVPQWHKPAKTRATPLSYHPHPLPNPQETLCRATKTVQSAAGHKMEQMKDCGLNERPAAAATKPVKTEKLNHALPTMQHVTDFVSSVWLWWSVKPLSDSGGEKKKKIIIIIKKLLLTFSLSQSFFCIYINNFIISVFFFVNERYCCHTNLGSSRRHRTDRKRLKALLACKAVLLAWVVLQEQQDNSHRSGSVRIPKKPAIFQNNLGKNKQIRTSLPHQGVNTGNGNFKCLNKIITINSIRQSTFQFYWFIVE